MVVDDKRQPISTSLRAEKSPFLPAGLGGTALPEKGKVSTLLDSATEKYDS